MARQSKVVNGRRVCARSECPRAGEWQPVSAFAQVTTRAGRTYVYSYCRECKNRIQKRYSLAHYQRHKEHYREKARAVYQRKPRRGRKGTPLLYPVVDGRKRCGRCHQWKRVVADAEGNPPEFHVDNSKPTKSHGWCKSCREAARQEKKGQEK